MRIYLSGPITNMPNLNRPAFDAEARRLRGQNHFVINPHDITPIFGTAEEIARSFDVLYTGCDRYVGNDGKTIFSADLARSVMDADLAAVRNCDAIYLLRGWEKSRGAKKELAEALAHGLQIMQEGGEWCDTRE